MPQRSPRVRSAPAAATHPLVVVMSRDRASAACRRAPIPSSSIARAFDLPGSRTFALTGSASVNPGRDRRRDRRPRSASRATVTADAASASLGRVPAVPCRRARPTAIRPRRGTRRSSTSAGSGCEVRVAPPDHVLQHGPAGRRRRPALGADGDRARRRRRGPGADAAADRRPASENATATVPLRFPAMTGRRVRVTITGVRVQLAHARVDGRHGAGAGRHRRVRDPRAARRAGARPRLPGRCRSGSPRDRRASPFPVRVPVLRARPGICRRLAVTPCDPRDPCATCRRSRSAAATTWCAPPTGVRTGAATRPRGAGVGGRRRSAGGRRRPGHRCSAPRRAPSRRCGWCSNGATRMRVHVTGADAPFWLVLGESHSRRMEGDGRAAGARSAPSHLVDGYANGWLVRPEPRAFDVVLEWTPQRQVWAAIWASRWPRRRCASR